MKIGEAKLEEVKGVKRSYLARLSALTSNRAKRSDNFYNFLTSSEISNQKLKFLKSSDRYFNYDRDSRSPKVRFRLSDSRLSCISSLRVLSCFLKVSPSERKE